MITERYHREWWVSHDGRVVRAVGYACEGNADSWWFPTLGFTATEGFHVFPDRDKAITATKAALTAQLSIIQRQLRQLDI